MTRKEKELNNWLFQAAKDGDIISVKRAIECGADVNAKDRFKKTPLHRASRNGYTDIVKLLIENGADFDHPDQYRQTPLHLATEYRHDEIAKMLLEKGAYLMIQENLNKQLLRSVGFGDLEAAKKAIEDGADVNYEGDNDFTPLWIATCILEEKQSRLQELVELRGLLEQHGAIDERVAV